MQTFRLMTLLVLLPLITIITARAQPGITKLATASNQELQSGNEEMSKVKPHIAELLKNKTTVFIISDDNMTAKNSGSPKDIKIQDDRIEIKIKNQNMIINFSDILDETLKAIGNEVLTDDGKSVISSSSQLTVGNFQFEMKGSRAFELADDLIFIQNILNKKRYSAELVLFEPIAAHYRALQVKQPVSEGQREYIVQANSFNQKKMYNKAIELYKKAVELDQTAFPAAYSNLALLSAQVNKFDAAIYYMKKYLLLEPGASDARTAQDKIYEWKAQVGI